MTSDVVWSGIEAACSALLSIAAAFVIARLIGPGEVGIGAAAIAVQVPLWVVVNALFADALVQRATLDETAANSAVWASTAVGCAAGLLLAASGWLLSEALRDSRLTAMALVLAAPFPFIGAAGALQGLVTRQRRYRLLATRTILGQGAGTIAGIALALHNAGAWAAVGQQAIVTGVSALVLLAGADWRPRAAWNWREIAALLRTGLPLTASTLAQIGRYRLFALLIGGTAGATALGQIHIAFRLADTVRDILFTALWRLLLPALSRHRHLSGGMLPSVDRLLRLSSAVTLPICGGLALALGPLTALALGPAWRDAGEAALPLVALTALLALMFPSGVALVAAGQARFTLYANLAGVAATAVFVLAARPADPWSAVLVWCGAQLFVSPYALWVNGRALGCGGLRPLRAGVPMLLAVCAATGLAMLAGGDGPFPVLIRRGAVFVFVLTICAGPLIWLLRAGHSHFKNRVARRRTEGLV